MGTEGDDTWTSRSTPAARQASTTARVPATLVRSYAAHGPVTLTLAARWTTASWPGHGIAGPRPASATSASTSGSPSPAGRRCSTVTRSPRSASARAVAAPSIPLAPVTRTLTAGRARRRPAPDPPTGRLAARSIFDACRMSTGSCGWSAPRPRERRGRRTPQRGPSSQRVGETVGPRLDHDHHLLGARRDRRRPRPPGRPRPTPRPAARRRPG